MIIWSNGCFDILHSGHVEMLEHAKSLGIKLIVGLDTDKHVQDNKGYSRPHNCLADRMRVIGALRCVDEVVSFGSDAELLIAIKDSNAELIVIGDDYKDKRVIGSELIPVQFFSRIDGYSSTGLINALRF
jgi:D-beta-D-heptose 7-phosphate kinase / D-beta-D-heptose 1-phosphate adenosyltransferase